MNSKTKSAAVATLVIIAPCCTELLSSNVPATVFFRPSMLFPLMLVYGLPALLIRDLWVRWHLNVRGLFCLGLAYGIYNEGIIAQTLRLSVHVPIDTFDGYCFLGVNWPWASLILPWHALHAIVFPIAITTWLFPSQRTRQWFSSSWFGICLVFIILFGVVVFLTNKKMPFSPILLIIFLTAMGLLSCLAKRLNGSSEFLENHFPVHAMAAVAGLAFYPSLVMGLAILSKARMPAFMICGASGLILYGLYRLLCRLKWLSSPSFLLFVFGDYLAGSMFTIFVMFHHGSPLDITVVCVLAGIFCLGIFSITFLKVGVPSS